MNRMLKVFVILNVCVLLLYTIPKAEIPNLISYQARLFDNTGTVIADGTYQLSFSIYDSELNGLLLWNETHPTVIFSDGSFSVYLGSVTPIADLVFSDSSTYLEISFNGETMSPRSRLLSVPYAYQSNSSEFATSAATSSYSDSTNAITDGAVDMTDIAQAGATIGQVIKWNGTAWLPATHNSSFSDSTDAITDGAVDMTDIAQAGATIGQVIKWNGIAWVPTVDNAGSSGWNWSDSSSHGADSVLFADSSNHADNATNATTAITAGTAGFSDSTDAITDGAVDMTDISQAGATSGQVIKWNGTAWLPSVDEGATNGGLVITPDQFASLGNAITILDANGNTSMTFTINSFGRGFIEFYDPIDSNEKNKLNNKAASQKIASLSSDGLTFFGATPSDTNTQIFSNGDIISKGQITMGENSSGATAWATVFGFNNIASGDSATIGGGSYNTASGIRATIGGGGFNNAFGGVSTIGGGAHNTIDSGAYTTIGGGHGNTIWGNLSTIAGGAQNSTNDSYATVGGGGSNSADNNGSTVSGGYSNTAGGWRATIGGGTHDTASASHSTIGGGELNYIDVQGYHATIGGGLSNDVNTTSSTISGGELNTISIGGFSTIGGGRTNTGSGNAVVIGGGYSNTVTGNYSVIGGGFYNAATGHNSTISGGQYDTTSGLWATICGGRTNNASGDYSFIGAGQSNNVNGDWSSIGGGQLNTTTNYYSTIAGGYENNANGNSSFIGGGRLNIVTGDYATISGGYKNLASGHFAIASGYQAQALHYGSMAFFAREPMGASDSLMTGGIGQIALGAKGCFYFTNSPGTATYDLTKLINTSTGAYLTTGGVWTNSSDKNLKENFEEIDEQEILTKLSTLDLYQWNYKTENENIQHIGPTAQDFHQLFGLGNDNKSISTIDPSGVALVAIKALTDKYETLNQQYEELHDENELLKKQIEEIKELKKLVKTLLEK